MKKILYKLKSKFLTIFGDIRVSKFPPFIFYDDINFAVKGKELRDILSVCKPGDIVLRGYDSYLDSKFIKSSRKYSHAGIVSDKKHIIHAIAPNVTKVDILDFCYCDRIAILRPKKDKTGAIIKAKKFLKNNIPYDFNFTHGRETLYCFELAACCYPRLRLQKKSASILFGLIKKKEQVYLSDSFLDSEDFELVYEYNPKFNIKYKK